MDLTGIFKAYDVRGLYPAQINGTIAERIGRAFAEFCRAGTVAVGRDMRSHSPELLEGLCRGLIAGGCEVLELGLVSTPMCYHAVGAWKCSGGVMITASHNPGKWNGFKFCLADAVPVSKNTGLQEICRMASAGLQDAAQPGRVVKHDIAPVYGDFVRKFSRIDRKLKVVADFANGMGSREIAGIRDLFEVIPLYEEMDGTFPNHEANPLKLENMADLCAKVRETGADFGAAFDGDADRCGFVDETGAVIPMDLFTALIAKDILQESPATILYDLRSSRAVPECIAEEGGTSFMTPVGHSFIKQKMREHQAVFAGELSGHYYFKENFFAESQAMALVKFANLLCRTGEKASALVQPLKRYASTGEVNFEVDDVPGILQKIRQKYADGELLELDGISIAYPTWHCNVRASNTEPLLRLIIEADNAAILAEKQEELRLLICQK